MFHLVASTSNHNYLYSLIAQGDIKQYLYESMTDSRLQREQLMNLINEAISTSEHLC